MWTGLVWLRIGTGGELLWIRYWTFGFHKMLGNYRASWQLRASPAVLSSIEFVRDTECCGTSSGTLRMDICPHWRRSAYLVWLIRFGLLLYVEAIHCAETSVNSWRFMWLFIPEDRRRFRSSFNIRLSAVAGPESRSDHSVEEFNFSDLKWSNSGSAVVRLVV
jgi:hypothetical protein